MKAQYENSISGQYKTTTRPHPLLMSFQNRMSDALLLFAYICNHDYFLKAGMILFLNKKDLFQKKLETVPLSSFFKAYTGLQSIKKS